MDKFREAQEQFEAKEFEILGLQSTNENKGLKPRLRPPLTIKSIVTSPCSRPGMETSGYENPLHDSVPHTPETEEIDDVLSEMSWNMSDQDPRTHQRQGHGQVKTRGWTGTGTRPDLTFKDYPLLWGRYRAASATWISYTPKHRKKTFYRCRKDQENQCQFFQWTQFQTLGGPGSVEARHR